MFDDSLREERRQSLLYRYSQQLGRIVDRSQAELAFSRGVKLRRVDALMHNVVESSFDGIMTIREDGRIETANEAALGSFGYSRDEIGRCQVTDLFPELSEVPDAGDMATLLRLGAGHREILGQRKDKSTFPLELAVSETFMESNRLFVVIIRDITDRMAQQDELRHQALHDALTGLPNRVLLSDRLSHALDLARRANEPMALVLLDLDRFKEVNDTLGHQIGDLVLIEVARRLAKPIRASDTVARLGGDEFAVLLPAVTDLEQAQLVADRIVKVLNEPFHVVDGLMLEVGVSIGIALFPDHAEDGGKLLQCADVAMYTAKQEQSGIALYDQGKDNHSVRHLTLTGELRQAIEENHLEFHYQPKIDISTQQIVSVEALARWNHPEHGQIPPDEFISHAERTGLIEPLTTWAFTTAFEQLVAWRDTGLDLSISVNLSARNLHEERLPEVLDELFKSYAVAPDRLILEITESAIMIDPDGAMDVVKRLAALGLCLSIDDFGTGYSSLSYLRRLPVQELKIDQSFVYGMDQNEGDFVIVRSTIDLAHNLGLTVVAEGIENERHIELLQGLGCDIGQGFFISKALKIEDLNAWLKSSPWAAQKNDVAAAE
jgi:diguanylate cyclase (GGDEF)-like protein/PAS domain S-box-containing protein